MKRRRARRNPPVPYWLVFALVASGLVVVLSAPKRLAP